MGNEKDTLALFLEVLHDLHELFNLLWRKHSRRLIENEDLVIAVEHLKNLYPLLHSD